ncbi:MAG: TetR/AcrR family transcriptional regulator [Dongiaceae bacterium]
MQMPPDTHPHSHITADPPTAEVAGAEPHWRQRRRRNILAAAGELFSLSSYDAVQMDDIARLARVGKPTIYRYFASKDELFLEVFKEALQELERGIEAVVTSDKTATQALGEILRLSFALLGSQVSALRLLTGDQPQLIVRWRNEFGQRRGSLMTAFRRVLERGTATGEFRPVDLDTLPAILVGVIRGGLMGVDDPEGRRRLPDAAIDLLLSGLRGK